MTEALQELGLNFGHRRVADATGVVPQFFGKPFFNIYQYAFAQLAPGAIPRVGG